MAACKRAYGQFQVFVREPATELQQERWLDAMFSSGVGGFFRIFWTELRMVHPMRHYCQAFFLEFRVVLHQSLPAVFSEADDAGRAGNILLQPLLTLVTGGPVEGADVMHREAERHVSPGW